MACYPNVWSVPIDILNHVYKYAEEIQAEHACVCLFLLEVAFVAGFVFSSFFQLVISFFSDYEIVSCKESSVRLPLFLLHCVLVIHRIVPD